MLFDTDIGTDIDDAYALALILRSPELELLGVTTVSGDAVARARLAAKLLAVEGGAAATIPVYAGTSTATQYLKQAEWAVGLRVAGAAHRGRRRLPARADRGAAGPAHHRRRRRADQRRGAADVVAGHRRQDQADRADGRRGAARRTARLGAAAGVEHQVERRGRAARCSRPACRSIVAPLDATADLKLTPEHRVRLFTRGSPLTDALAALDYLWTHTNTWKGADADPVRPAADRRALRAGHRALRVAARRRRGRRPHARGQGRAGERARRDRRRTRRRSWTR